MGNLAVQNHDSSKLTPIEIVLGIDGEGKTTARKLYEYLSGEMSHYSRWVKRNIVNNEFTEEDIDYFSFATGGEYSQRGQFAQDYKLTASFAKKLAMKSHTVNGEIARDYFIKIEDKLKQIALKERDNVTREISKLVRNELTDTLKESGLDEKMHGYAYKTFTDLIYKLVLGMNAKKYRETFMLANNANVRQYVNQYQLYEITRLEKVSQGMIDIGMDYSEIKQILSDKFLKRLS